MKPRFRQRSDGRRSAFGTLLIGLLDERGLTVEAFATKVGKPRSSLFRIVAGTLKPPLADLDGWVTALDLDKKETVALSLAAVEGHGCMSLRAAMGQ